MLDYIMGEKPTDREYVLRDQGTLSQGPQSMLVAEALKALWYRYNMGNEDGVYPYRFRSMCIGDIVVFPRLRQVWVVERDGWRSLQGTDIPFSIVWEVDV
jgi:hypothetical protein